MLLQAFTLNSVHSGVEVMLEPYACWYREQPLADVRYYADLLRLLDWQRPGERWLLKSPAHLWGIDELFEVVPRCRGRLEPPRSDRSASHRSAR